jgi:hypothetical protein
MRIKFGYLVGLLFLAVFAVILLNLGTIRENLESLSCPTGYNYEWSSNTCIPSGGGPFICPRSATKVRGRNGSEFCVDNSRLEDALKNGGPGGPVTLSDSPPSPQQGLAEPQEVPAEFMGCPIGCFSDGVMCLKNGGGRCDSKQCPNGQTESMGGCYRNCAAGKKLDNRTCVVDRTVLASESNNTNNTVPPPTRSANTSASPQGVSSCDIEKFAAY